MERALTRTLQKMCRTPRPVGCGSAQLHHLAGCLEHLRRPHGVVLPRRLAELAEDLLGDVLEENRHKKLQNKIEILAKASLPSLVAYSKCAENC